YTKLAFTNNFYLIIIALICSFPIAKLIKKINDKSSAINVASTFLKIPVNLALILVSSIMLVDATNNPFLYFRF
ncbi:MAG: MBOAT family protein, partial [Porcipelethomonas sp.]